MKKNLFSLLILLAIVGCNRSGKKHIEPVKEDRQAKTLLQGIWMNSEDGDAAFKAKGDSIFYPDSTSQPVRFMIIKDSLVLQGSNKVKYRIVKQSEHAFQFKNQNGDLIKLIKSEDANDEIFFSHKHPTPINQNRLIKRDTIVSNGKSRYHCYLQINPTTYKVVKLVYNDDGVEVDNVYYDNIIHISVFEGTNKLFSHDFKKQEFADRIPKSFLKQSILSDMIFDKTDSKGIHYKALVCIPDEASSYIVGVVISYKGKVTTEILKY